MSDRLTLTRAFEGAGVASAAAERLATEIFDAIHDGVATKADLARIEGELRSDLETLAAELRSELQSLGGELRSDLQKLETRLRSDLQAVETGLRSDLAVLRGEIGAREHWRDRRVYNLAAVLGALVVAVAGLLFAALHYWPPHV